MGDRPLLFLERHCKPLQASPRLLAVAIDAPHLALVVLVAHAPHAADDEKVREEFWEEVEHIHDRWGVDIMLCDANAHVGSDTSAAIGGEGFREQQDLSGSMFHSTLHHMEHVAVNTHMSTGPVHYTFIKKRPKKDPNQDEVEEDLFGPELEIDKYIRHRKDYVTVSRKLWNAVRDSWVISDLDSLHGASDHMPVTATFDAICEKSAKSNCSFLLPKQVANEDTEIFQSHCVHSLPTVGDGY